MENSHSICFANSVIQCIAYLSPFRDCITTYLDRPRPEWHGIGSPVDQAKFEANVNLATSVAQSLHSITSALVDSTAIPLPAGHVHALFQKLPPDPATGSKRFVYNRQEDAHEFLLAIFSALHGKHTNLHKSLLVCPSNPDLPLSQPYRRLLHIRLLLASMIYLEASSRVL